MAASITALLLSLYFAFAAFPPATPAVQFVIADRTLPAPASGRIGPEVTQGSVSLRNIHRMHSGGPAVVPYVAIDRW